MERGGDDLGLEHVDQTEINEIDESSVHEGNPDEDTNQEGAEGAQGGEDEGAHGTKCFKNLIDKPVAEEIKLFEWCPTMDLLAWITADDQLIVQRLSWQRLFSIRTHDQPITALTWRPDGKVIAVGHQDGKISLVDVENGTSYFSSQFHSASVTCLHWAQETAVGAPPAGALQHAHIHYLVDRTERVVGMATTTNAAARMPPPNQLNILVSGDETGKVILSALGTFCVGMADIRAMANSQQAQAMKVNLSADLKHLYIAIEGTLDWEYLTVRDDSTAQYSFLSPLPPKTPSSYSSSSMSPDSSPTLALIDLNTSLLWSRRQELKLIAVQSAYISSHLSHIDTTLQLMGDKWGHVIGEFNTRCNDFSNMLQENNSITTVRQELLYFLVTGVPSADLERFLLTTLTESGVRKLGKGIEAGCARLEELLITHLKPASETLLFRLSELQGRAKWYEQFGIIGLEEESLSFLLQKASLFVRRTEELAKILSELKRKYSAFFNWLLAGTLRLADMLTRRRMKELAPIDEKAVSDFLNDNLGKDLIAPFFKEAATDDYANPERQAAATATATPAADNSMLLPSPGGVGAMSQLSATPSFARRIASHSSSPFMLSSSISPFTNVSPRSAAFQLPGQGVGAAPDAGVASTPARPNQNAFTSSQLHPRGVNPVTALGSLSAFSTPSPASGSAASSSSFAGTPSNPGGLPRFSPSSIAASVARMQLSSISALSTPSSASRGGYSSRGPTPSFVVGLNVQASINAHGTPGSSLGGSAPSLKQMFSDMAAIYEETFIMPSQTLAKSFTIDNAIPLLAIKMKETPAAAAAKPAPSSAATAPPEPPKPKQEKRERNYWEEDDDDEAETEEAAAADADFIQQAEELDDEEDGGEGEEEIPDQVLTAFFTETVAKEGSRNDSGVCLHLTAFHSSAPMPASLQDALGGGDASFSFLDDTSAAPSEPKRCVWLLRKRYPFHPRQHRRRQGLKEVATAHDPAANVTTVYEDYSVGALRLPRDNAEVMHLSFYNKDTLAVLSCATTFSVDHSIDPLVEPEGSVVETVLELLPITEVTFVPIPDRCQLSSSRMNLVQRMLADKSFVSSTPSEVKSRLQPPNAAGAAVSGTRNVAAVYAAPKRLLFYDLLDEEEEEEEDDEEEEEEEGGAIEEEEGKEATTTTNTSHLVRDEGEEEEEAEDEEESGPAGSRDGSFMDE